MQEILSLPLSHRPKQGAYFAWAQESGAKGRARNANLLGVKAGLLGVCLGWRLCSLGKRPFQTT